MYTFGEEILIHLILAVHSSYTIAYYCCYTNNTIKECNTLVIISSMHGMTMSLGDNSVVKIGMIIGCHANKNVGK